MKETVLLFIGFLAGGLVVGLLSRKSIKGSLKREMEAYDSCTRALEKSLELLTAYGIKR